MSEQRQRSVVDRETSTMINFVHGTGIDIKCNCLKSLEIVHIEK